MIAFWKSRLGCSLLSVGAAGLLVLGGALWLFFGGLNTGADAGWSKPAAWVIHRTMLHSVKARSDSVGAPPPITPDAVRAGFVLYDSRCAMCHGGPGLPRQPWTAGMEPSPPYLLDARRQWRRPDLFWIISNGVKATGMPAWRDRLEPGQIWSLTAFIEALPYLQARDYARLRAAAAGQERAPTRPADLGPRP